MSKVLTPARRARLEKLAAYLEGLPKDYQHFDMRTYFDGAFSSRDEADYGANNGGLASCGTVACAVGHGPAAGIPVPEGLIYNRTVSWNEYAHLFVGNVDGRAYAWAFHDEWGKSDNHHWGAAARLRYLLDHGTAPRTMKTAPWGSPMVTPALHKLYAPYRIDASVDTRRMAETALAGSGRSPSGAVPATPGDAQ